MLGASFAFYSQTTSLYEPGGIAHFIMANLIAVCLFAWVACVQYHSMHAHTPSQPSSDPNPHSSSGTTRASCASACSPTTI